MSAKIDTENFRILEYYLLQVALRLCSRSGMNIAVTPEVISDG